MNITHNPAIKYRPEVDGLRAVAVLPVVFFHAGFNGFTGGFVGVDVFFVISGYLITSILMKEMERDSFSILKFYERRARRILPALFFVILCSLPISWLWMSPDELKRFGQSLVAVAMFSSNIYFWKKSDYFAPDAEDQPLLHTWSLAVEEQYYLLFPVFLILFWRLGKNKLFYLIAALTVFSFALCEWGWRIEPTANFYLLPTRAWELFVGSLITFWHPQQHKYSFFAADLTKNILSALGLGLIIFAIIILDKSTPFPSFYTLLPVLGAALVISFSTADNQIGKFLGSKIAVAIGVASFSIYLWHQLFFSLARLVAIDTLSISDYFILCFFTLIFAFLTQKFVEEPFRQKKALSRNRVFGFSSVGLVLLGTTGLMFHLNQGFEDRISPKTLAQLNIYKAYGDGESLSGEWRHGRCFLYSKTDNKNSFDKECYGTDSQKPKIYLIGDSHAAALYPGLKKQFLPAKFEIAQLTISGCLPIIGDGATGPSRCQRLSDARFDAVQENPNSIVILHAYWPKKELSDPSSRVTLELHATLDELTKKVNPEHILLVGCVPTWAPSLPGYLAKKHLFDTQTLPETVYNPNLFERNACNTALQQIALAHKTKFFNPIQSLCNNGNCLIQANRESGGEELMQFDYGHLTLSGSNLLAGKIVKKYLALP